MNFKEFYLNESILEVVDIKAPKGSRQLNRMLNPHTNTATPIFGEKFTTSLGNKVEVIFIPESGDSYEVVFTVNNSYDDDSAKSSGRDPEIFSGVMYLIKKITDKRLIDNITFKPRSGKGDVRVVKGLDNESTKSELLKSLDDVENQLKHAEYPTEPSPVIKRLWASREQDITKWNGFDTYIKPLENDIRIIRSLVNQNNPLFGKNFRDYGYTIDRSDKVKNLDLSRLLQALKNHGDALLSNTDDGLKVNKNRREAIYDRLVKKYMGDWDVEKSFGSFILKRKMSSRGVYK